MSDGELWSLVEVEGAAEMRAFAGQVANSLQPGDVWLLVGQLGSGKTVFVQGLAEALKVEGHVTSPTFGIVSEYRVGVEGPVKLLAHADLYRLSEAEARTVVGDLFEGPANQERVLVIEWADRLGAEEMIRGKVLRFDHGETENKRTISLERALAKQLQLI